MKKALFALILFSIFFTGCNKNDEANSIYEIGENMFITQIDNINLNYREYLGRTIRLEGLFKALHWEGNNYYYVIRNGPGCCGDDGEVGFEVSWKPEYNESFDDDIMLNYPNTNDWVQATGELKSYNFMGMTFIYLALSDLDIMQERGAEFVIR